MHSTTMRYAVWAAVVGLIGVPTVAMVTGQPFAEVVVQRSLDALAMIVAALVAGKLSLATPNPGGVIELAPPPAP